MLITAAAVTIQHADAWSDAFKCQGWWDFSCNMQAGWASVFGNTMWWMISLCKGAFQSALDWTNASKAQLEGVQTLANTFFAQVAILILIITFIIELSRAGWRMSIRGFLMAMGRAVGAIAGFRIGIYLFANPNWSVISLFDKTITNGLMSGMGMSTNGDNNPILVSLGLAGAKEPDDLAKVFSSPGMKSIFTVQSLSPSASGTLFTFLILGLVLVGIVWLFALVFTAILTFRLLALLTMVAIFPFVMALFGESRFGTGALKKWVTTFAALLVSKPLCVVILGVGVTINKSATDYGQFSLNMWLASLIMLAAASMSPFFCLKFFQWASIHAAAESGDPASATVEQGARQAGRAATNAAKSAAASGGGA